MAHHASSMASRQWPTWRRRVIQSACGLSVLALCVPAQADSEPFIGALMPMAGNPAGSTCPRGWLPADGRALAIASNALLYSLLGTAYGGDGKTTFALPNLSGTAAVGMGQGPGLSPLDWGEQGGSTSNTLTLNNLPAHSHGTASATAATHATPGPARTLAQAQNAGLYASGGTPFALAPTGSTGQGTPVPTMSPYLVITWCIAVTGDFPPRP